MQCSGVGVAAFLGVLPWGHAVTENVIEIFSSIQGEGVYVGYRQAFLRLEDCNLHCRYCDTAHERGTHPFCSVQIDVDGPAFRSVPNPLSAKAAAAYIAGYTHALPHQAVSLTGGEPLLHPAYIRTLASFLTTPLLLETNGTLPEALADVLPVVDIVSMDLKLPALTGRGTWKEHQAFLRLARQKEVYVKIVVGGESPLAELERAFTLVSGEDPGIPVILQPVTPFGDVPAPAPEFLLQAQRQALKVLRNVRVIPQTHVMMGQR